MRILFLTQVLPFPLDAGPKVRAHYVLRYLVEAGHDVHLVSFVRPGDSENHVAALRRLCSAVDTVPMVRSRLRDVRDGLRSLRRRQPFLVVRDDVPAMRETIMRVAGGKSFDALHADQLWMASYGLQGGGAGSLSTVLDKHNAVFQVPRQLAEHHSNPIVQAVLRSESARLEVYEREACLRFDHVVWVTGKDHQAVLPGGDPRRASANVIPIAVDPAARPRLERSRPFRVTFLGGLHWPPNREGAAWFLKRVWPRIAAAVPSAVFTVLGRDGARALPRADKYPRVEVTGYVNDPRPFLASTAAFVVPLKSGAGMRVKILDAWCWGIPVVSTTLGAEGLRAVHGDNLLLADDEHGFADAVIGLMRNPRTAGQLVEGGRATVEGHYDWRTVYTAWDKVYGPSPADVAGPRTQGPGSV